MLRLGCTRIDHADVMEDFFHHVNLGAAGQIKFVHNAWTTLAGYEAGIPILSLKATDKQSQRQLEQGTDLCAHRNTSSKRRLSISKTTY